MKKDNYLQELVQAPPKERAKIAQFDARTMREAFVVGLEGLKGVSSSVLRFLVALAISFAYND